MKSDSHRSIELSFNRKPSAICTLWKGFISGNIKNGKDNKVEVPEIKTICKNVTISKSHLKAYSKICGINLEKNSHVLYPLTLIYPFNLRMISLKEFSPNIFGMLNRRTLVNEYSPLSTGSKFDILCNISEKRFMEKGLEVDIRSTLNVEGEIAWECVNTFYFKGWRGDSVKKYTKAQLSKIQDADTIESWYLPSGNGFRFSRISGDSNGIHYSKKYAKLLGFKRDFAHPMLIAGKCIDILKNQNSKMFKKVDLHYKGQVYYENNLSLKHMEQGSKSRFDLYCEGNDRPCICGEVY